MKKEDFTDRCPGKLVKITEGGLPLLSFVPDPLPRRMPSSATISKLNEQAGLKLGTLFGAEEVLNPWIHHFLTREAIASNAIEGTIVRARELYLFQVEGEKLADKKTLSGDQAQKRVINDRKEVQNYVVAMGQGIDLMKERPISLNLINILHATLLTGVRGQDKSPGQLRSRQNAISSGGFADARFVPPPPSEVLPAISDLEKFIHDDVEIPNLVRVAMVHYQFETIHPYLDGNGRLGRLLIPLLLSTWEMLPAGLPILYLSKYFEQHNPEYRNCLLRVSQNGEWDHWIEFFLNAVISESKKAWDKASELRKLRDNYIEQVKSGSGKLQVLVRKIFDSPVLRLKDIVSWTGVSKQQAGNYANKLAELDILKKDTSQKMQIFYAEDIFRVFFEEPESEGF